MTVPDGFERGVEFAGGDPEALLLGDGVEDEMVAESSLGLFACLRTAFFRLFLGILFAQSFLLLKVTSLGLD